ncbi:MAG: YIP1 family protein [Acidobacteriota bacterium]|nr:YIP1 family protein [Acidobacteriota bacterium]
MGTIAPELPANSGENIGSDIAGMGSFFLDPARAARRVHSRWFWIAPLLLFSIVSIIASYVIMPMTRHVMEVAPLPSGVSPEQYQHSMELGLTIQRVSMYFAPVMAALIFAIQAAVLLGTGAVMSVDAKFRQLFNLIAGCSLIQVLAAVAGVVILKAKGGVSTLAELRPALGLDIFLPEGTNKFLAAVLGYFSVFELWWIVMMVLIYSAAFRVTRGKAFAVILPLILLSIILRVAGAAFSR